ncbi:MAG TPA: histidine phosphatase family protein [Thermoleophilia bacterium]|nr:histidine phosphatase family protein [Thermoleophilia bacterium]
MNLYLARHGQTDWNVEPARCQGWAEVPLNEAGGRQARELAARLRGAGVELIVTSHLLRATQTAEELRDALRAEAGYDPPVTIDPRLAETFRGAWQGRTFESIIRTEPATWAAYREHPESFCFPQGESLAEQQRRVLEAVRDAALTGRVALLVTHGGSIRLVRAFIDGSGVESYHRTKIATGEALAVDAAGLAARIDRFLGLAPAPDEGTIEASGTG